jgi:hypothetical protein
MSVVSKLKRAGLPMLAVALIIVIGGYFLFQSHAATPVIAAEPETGSINAPASLMADSASSAGKAVLFAAPPSGNLTVPADLLDLTNWKVTLPICADGSQSCSTPLEVTQPKLKTYSVSPWFQLNAAKTAILFRANHGGVTTSGSSNPRSELREMTSNGSANASWSSTSGTHTMWIKEAITHLTTVKPQTVVGQIHDANDDITVFRLEGSNLYITDANTTHAYLITSTYTLGTIFTVKMSVTGGVISYYYNEKLLPFTEKKSFSGAYFKIGNYTQSNPSTAPSESPSAYAETAVYDFKVTHQ